jgi:hypothetical protein
LFIYNQNILFCVSAFDHTQGKQMLPIKRTPSKILPFIALALVHGAFCRRQTLNWLLYYKSTGPDGHIRDRANPGAAVNSVVP